MAINKVVLNQLEDLLKTLPESDVEHTEALKYAIRQLSSEYDPLEQLFGWQYKLMIALGIPEPNSFDEVGYINSPWFAAAVSGLVTEAAEVLDGLSVVSKPWKQTPANEIEKRVIGEATDVLFMLIELFIMAKVTPSSLITLYKNKLVKNLYRLTSVGDNKNATDMLTELGEPITVKHSNDKFKAGMRFLQNVKNNSTDEVISRRVVELAHIDEHSNWVAKIVSGEFTGRNTVMTISDLLNSPMVVDLNAL